MKVVYIAGYVMASILILSSSINGLNAKATETYMVQPREISEEYLRKAQEPKETMEVSTEEITEKPAEIAVEIPEQTKEEENYRYIEECTLSKEIQEQIFDICKEKGISFEFVMAVIKKESTFGPSEIGDGGESYGLMQVQPKWHYETMEKLGVTNLLDPIDNVDVGTEILCQYFEENDDVYYVLMKYNGGPPHAKKMMAAGKVSEYAKIIVETSIKYEEQNGIVG